MLCCNAFRISSIYNELKKFIVTPYIMYCNDLKWIYCNNFIQCIVRLLIWDIATLLMFSTNELKESIATHGLNTK